MLQLSTILNAHFKEMCDSAVALYRVNVSSDAMWNAYIKGFSKDPIFRDPESSEHNCNCCKHFIHHYGNIVAINDDYSITSIWDIDNIPEEYKQSISNLKELIHSANILIKKEEEDDLAFLEEDKALYSDDQLRYDIAVDVYKTKKAELQQKHEDAEKKARNQHIAEIIARKQDAALESKSIEELQAMLKD